MEENQVLKLKVGDSFIFPDKYINDKSKVIRHNYKCHILAVIIDDDALQGFTIKRYLKTKKAWAYEFFDVFKVCYSCKTI